MAQAASSDANDVLAAGHRVSLLSSPSSSPSEEVASMESTRRSSSAPSTSAPSTAPSFFPRKMDHASVPTRQFSYDLLKEITDGFSEGRLLGTGGYGRVYKGVHKDGKTVAVKLLYEMPALDDVIFEREFNNLMCLQHDNIVRLVGYCRETRSECVQYEGRMVVADRIHRALCFEYAHKGSLHDNLSDEHNGHDWSTRYGIIKGICNGLRYLHHELKPPMYHLDLKPANVLLDENMLPKVADFGLSRLFGQEQTKITKSSIGTRGYLPPEYIERNEISNKFDIFSLGVVIIKVMAGPEGQSRCANMSYWEFVELVHGNWRDRLQASSIYKPELYYEQVKTCIEIALRCVETDRHKRPIITDIVDKMNETESNIRLWSPIEVIDLPSDQDKKQYASSDNMGRKSKNAYQTPYVGFQDLVLFTANFSEELGRGGRGIVYKGIDKNGREIAVKVPLRGPKGNPEKEFDREYKSLLMLKHSNIIQLVAYCHETENQYNIDTRKLDEIVRPGLCYEYATNGSLADYIYDQGNQLDLVTCYRIIMGICEGLNYLHHNPSGSCIYHLDLNPENILLTDSLVPKISGFGLFSMYSNAICKTSVTTLGTPRYSPPEYHERREVSKEFDIYSLGVTMIEIIAGPRTYDKIKDFSGHDVVEHVSKIWGRRGEYSEQVSACTYLALKCLNDDPGDRPEIRDIIYKLKNMEPMMSSSGKSIKNKESIYKKMGPNAHNLPFQHLKDITNKFSEERILGRGGFGVVYKGVLQGGETVAVKKFLQVLPSSEKQFENEVNLLMKLKHPNVVRLLGYCCETNHLLIPHEGKSVFVWNTELLLCLEYMPNGSLDMYISDATSGLDWQTRWTIIDGISNGLLYLHEQTNEPIVHMDLKPSNILLDGNMQAKITDFGWSRLIEHNQIIQDEFISGTLGYMPPELLRGIITPMSDVFSLGVIIMEIITGHRDYPYDIIKDSKIYIERELQKWRHRLQKEPIYTSPELDYEQIERCIQIGLICVNPDRTKRPTVKKVTAMLLGSEIINWYISNELSSQDIQKEP